MPAPLAAGGPKEPGPAHSYEQANKFSAGVCPVEGHGRECRARAKPPSRRREALAEGSQTHKKSVLALGRLAGPEAVFAAEDVVAALCSWGDASSMADEATREMALRENGGAR